MSTRPTVIDFDDGGISVRLDGKDLRVWEYRDDSERRIKMLCAREYVEGWCVGNQRVPAQQPAACPVDIAGWKLIPGDPTEQMWQAGRTADINPGDSYSKVWRAMLEAAPDVDDCETICTPHGAHEILDQLRCALNDIEISAYNAARYRIEMAIKDITIRVSPSFGKRA